MNQIILISCHLSLLVVVSTDDPSVQFRGSMLEIRETTNTFDNQSPFVGQFVNFGVSQAGTCPGVGPVSSL